MDIQEAEAGSAQDAVAAREGSPGGKQLQEMKNRKRKLVDPLQFEMSIQAEDLARVCAKLRWEMGPPFSTKQIQNTGEAGHIPEAVESLGRLAKLLDRLGMRRMEGLTTPKQIRFLEGQGISSTLGAGSLNMPGT